MGIVLGIVALAVLVIGGGVLIGWLVPAYKPEKRPAFHIVCNACRKELGPYFNMPSQIHCPHCHCIFTPPEIMAAQAWPQIVYGVFMIVLSAFFLWMFLG